MSPVRVFALLALLAVLAGSALAAGCIGASEPGSGESPPGTPPPGGEVTPHGPTLAAGETTIPIPIPVGS
ncbi:MAG TPA: hypothetical protein PLY91_09795 [Methanoregulaceae archaeon]|nr:hypothetical protein [Methanoregulaceae archaeon]